MKNRLLIFLPLALLLISHRGHAQTTASNGIITTPSTYNLNLRTQSSTADRLTIVNATGANQGFVGIGITSPLHKLHVNGTSMMLSGTSAPGSVKFEVSNGGIIGFMESVIATPTAIRMGSRGNHSLNLTTNNQNHMTIATDGKIGVGTITPLAKFHVDFANSNTNYSSVTNSDVSLLLKNVSGINNNFNIISFNDASSTAVAHVGTVTNHTDHTSKLFFATKPTSGNLEQRMTIDEAGKVVLNNQLFTPYLSINSATPAIRMQQGPNYLHVFDYQDLPNGFKAGGILVADDYVYASPSKNDMVVKGKIAIGTPNVNSTNNYTLTVNGRIGAKDIQIETNSNAWPDYVFKQDYQLPTLYEVEKYIQENSHLQDVPSAEQVKKEGYSVTNMDEILLRKVEELTLYIIEQQKQIDALKAQLETKK